MTSVKNRDEKWVGPSAAAQETSPEKKLFQKNQEATTTESTISRRSQQSPCRLSPSQERLWSLEQLQPNLTAYNIPYLLHLPGPLDIELLKRSLEAVVHRHEILRTHFEVIAGQVRQVIELETSLALPLTDLQTLPATDREDQVTALVRQELQTGFDLAQAPLLRAKLLRLAPEEHILLLTTHRLVADDESLGVLQRELKTLYEAFAAGRSSPLPEQPLHYADFAVWQQEQLQGPLREALAYWQARLGDDPEPLRLPIDRPRPPVQTFNGAQHLLSLPKSMATALETLGQQEKAALFTTLLAVFKVLLYRYTHQTDILVGAPIANRRQQALESLIGPLANTLVLRTELAGNPTFRELLGRVRETTAEAHRHQAMPFETLIQELQPDRDMSRAPFFQVMFDLKEEPEQTIDRNGLTISPRPVESGTALFDLTLLVTKRAAGLDVVFEYNPDLFHRSTIERMGGHFKTLAAGVIANPDTAIAHLPVLTEDERRQILVDWNQTQTDYPRDQAIHRLFETQAAQRPEAVALVFEDTRLTYDDLNRRANQLAHYLVAAGVKPNDLIGLCLERSPEMVIGMLAVLKVGAAYVPFDPAYPPDRLAFMLADTQTPLLLAQQPLLERLPAYEGRQVCLDAGWAETAGPLPQTNLAVQAGPHDLAYVMYTSGSTGRPKGVSVTHRNVVRLVKNTNYAALTPAETFLQFAPISFDAATLEIWGPLLNGARLVIFPAERASLDRLGEIIEQHQITTLWLTAGLFHQMVDTQLDKLKSVRQLLAGGDILSVPHVNKVLRALPECQLINGYGPTENTTFTTCHRLPPGEPVDSSVPIGRPIANTQVYILDDYLQPVPVGAPGELYTGGDGVARGYLHRPELTAERFIPDPFSSEPGGRLYKTGDLARYQPEGAIEFLGRIDTQVKIRGFRIELGEIETVLSQYPTVADSVVIAREDAPGDKRLVAYVTTPDRAAAISTADLRRFLKEQLPDYMIPAAFVTLDALPLTVNGKIDRQALPAPDMARPELVEKFVAPAGPVEEMLAEVWQEVLGLEQIGRHDNFFELGGHSLLAIRVLSRLRQEYDIDIPLRSLFETPIIGGLAPIIEESLMAELDEEF